MAGLYIHIPFCKKRCLYCDFFSSVSSDQKSAYIRTLCREIQLRKDFLADETIETIYFGGGTPSQLSASNFEQLFSEIKQAFPQIEQSLREVTLEANPDDISGEYLRTIRHFSFNRISLGIQSFNDEELCFLNRRHQAENAIRAVGLCREKGFDNISIDLMYGLPGQTLESWKKTLKKAIDLNVRHISAYHLIYEENTPLYELVKKGKIAAVDEKKSLQMFELLIDMLADSGFEQYEISNFARKGYRSRHNSSYWNGTHYLGLGASAHSYNGISRSWNAPALDYLSFVPEMETIDEKTAYNEFILTRLRTMDGISIEEISSLFETGIISYFREKCQKYLDGHLLEKTGDRIYLSRKGLFVSDGIMSDLMR